MQPEAHCGGERKGPSKHARSTEAGSRTGARPPSVIRGRLEDRGKDINLLSCDPAKSDSSFSSVFLTPEMDEGS